MCLRLRHTIWQAETSANIPKSQIPVGISALTALESLCLSDNLLSSLPPQIGSLTALKYLYCSNNFLVSLPGALCVCDGGVY